jgi:protein O-GlcNAc transferase
MNPMQTIAEMYAAALSHHRAQRLSEAEHIYRQILTLDSNQAHALHLLGVVASQVGKHEFAVDCISRAIQLNGSESAFYNNLGIAFMDQGKLEEAADAFRRALELNPDVSEVYSNLGGIYKTQGKLSEAVLCHRRALELKPDVPEAHNNLGVALMAQGKPADAVNSYRRALELKPDYAEAHSNLGNAFFEQGKLDEAVNCHRQALLLKPNFPEAFTNLGTAFQAQEKLEEAINAYRRALELKPEDALTHFNLGTALRDERKVDQAIDSFRRALELRPDYSEAHSNLLMALQYHADVTPTELSLAHADYENLHAAPLRTVWRRHKNHGDPQRPLRLGFVSADFGMHPVGFFLIGVLEKLDRTECETVCYSDRAIHDDFTNRFSKAATIWRDVRGLSDQELADVIAGDGIDILFDLAGHTVGGRPLLFARKPAPIQITWAGYVGTTGLRAMDYILADQYEIPFGAESQYCERVLRMPDGYICYAPPAYAPVVSPLPALKSGSVTFGSFNNGVKITSQVIELWARILRRMPESRLVLKFRRMDHPSIVKPMAMEFAAHGIDPERVEFLGWSSHSLCLQEYHRIDLGLDTFPYNGGLTTCEALWMGVPVITCPGETFASRHSLSHLSVMGLTESIAGDLDHYVELALSLANDLPRLASIRSNLRERMAGSPLCDGKRFAANLARILRGVWQEWRQQGVA